MFASASAPDGYTILAASTGPITTAPLVQRTPYDVQRDLAPVAQIGISPYVLIVRKDFPANNLQEFIAYVKANQAQLAAKQAEVEQDRALYELRRKQLDALHVRAGIPGVLQQVPVDVEQHRAIVFATHHMFVPQLVVQGLRHRHILN